jgi:two-component system response regulator PilR (NtrC family)
MAEILIVDDDDVIRDTLDELLSSEYQCETVETAEKALVKLGATPFEVVLTDISMPGLSGRELLERVLHLYPQTPVIIISGFGDEEHAQELLKVGAFDYLAKPFDSVVEQV